MVRACYREGSREVLHTTRLHTGTAVLVGMLV